MPYIEHGSAATSVQVNGHYYRISTTNGRATVDIEPTYPGVTGSWTHELGEDGNITSFRTPGSDEGRQRMLDRIRAAGADKIAELLSMDKSALPQAGFLRTYIDEVSARIHISLTLRRATTLTTLAKTL